VIAKAFGGDPNRAAAWIKDAWEKYYGRVLPGKSGAGPTYWRGKGKGGSTENDATMSLAKGEPDADETPRPCGDMQKGSHFRLHHGSMHAAQDGPPGVFRHLGSHPTRPGHITAKKLSTGKLHAFPKSRLVVPVPRPKILSKGAAGRSPFGGMGMMSREAGTDLDLKTFTQERRDTLAKQGKAMPGGGFPIENEQDLRNAIQAIGRASDPAAAKAHIIKRAKALGLTSLLPDDWNAGD
jgi:hypothetical protein